MLVQANGIFSASTLGIHTTYADQFDPPEIIPISKIDSPLALIPIHSQRIQKDLWVSVSFDHVSTIFYVVKKASRSLQVGTEPDDLFDDEDDEGEE